MKKLLIGLFACLCFTSCNILPIEEMDVTLIVTGCTNTNIREGITTYKISSFGPSGYWSNVLNYRAKIGTFEVGDTIVIVKNK